MVSFEKVNPPELGDVSKSFLQELIEINAKRASNERRDLMRQFV